MGSAAPGFNAWHADVAESPPCRLIFQQALSLPPEVVANSLLTWAGIEVTGKPDWYAAERTLWQAAIQADANRRRDVDP